MKKVLLSLIAGTMLSSTAFAVETIDASKLALPAEGQVCSALHSNIQNGINNNNLSKYEQCVMIVNDQPTAFKHKTFWTMVGTTFVPHNVTELGEMNSSERKEAIKETIIKTIIEKEIEYVKVEDTSKIEELKATINAYRTLSNSHAISYAQAAAQITKLAVEITELEAKIDALTNFSVKINPATDTPEFDIPALDKDEFKSKLELNLTTFGVYKFAVAKVGDKYFGSINLNNLAHAITNGYMNSIKNQLANIVGNAYANGYIDGFEDGFNQGYTQGFNDGYEAGYADGYSDGFRDGVASTK